MPRKPLAAATMGHRGAFASMRPRPDAAETILWTITCSFAIWGFNEAAARCRGNRPHPTYVAPYHTASMRPRPDAAETSDFPADFADRAALQ